MRSALRLLALMLVVGPRRGGRERPGGHHRRPGLHRCCRTPRRRWGMGPPTVTMTLVWLPTAVRAAHRDRHATGHLHGPRRRQPPDLLGRPRRPGVRSPTAGPDGHEYSIRVAACTIAILHHLASAPPEKDGDDAHRCDATEWHGADQRRRRRHQQPRRHAEPGRQRPAHRRPPRGRRAGSRSRPLTSTPTGPSRARSSSTIPTQTSAGAPPTSTPTPATLSAGDGIKKIGVVFGDGARQNTRPCAGLFCVITLGSPILGNASAAATDEILLDTVKPIALATQSAFTVDRGGSVSLDSTTSIDQNPPNASGVDPASATWQFKDGTPQATGAKVTHVFNQPGTFVGDLRVRDRAGNLSDIRQFAVTVNPGPGGSPSARSRGITGTAAFNLDRLRGERPLREEPPEGLHHPQRLRGPGGGAARRAAAVGARPAARQDRGQAAQGRGVHEDPQAAPRACCRGATGCLVRRPRRHPAAPR